MVGSQVGGLRFEQPPRLHTGRLASRHGCIRLVWRHNPDHGDGDEVQDAGADCQQEEETTGIVFEDDRGYGRPEKGAETEGGQGERCGSSSMCREV